MPTRGSGWLCLSLALLLGACTPRAQSGTDAAGASLAASTQARAAVQQYLDALAVHDYRRAATLFVGDWRGPAAHVLEDTTGVTLTAFLEQTCRSGLYVCGLRVRRFHDLRYTPPDTFLVGVEYADSAGARFTWGPCCGEPGAPDSVGGLRVVARDSGYAVLDLPLYIP